MVSKEAVVRNFTASIRYLIHDMVICVDYQCQKYLLFITYLCQPGVQIDFFDQMTLFKWTPGISLLLEW